MLLWFKDLTNVTEKLQFIDPTFPIALESSRTVYFLIKFKFALSRINTMRNNAYRGEQGKLETSVYRKPTHTDKYPAFDCHHLICHKKSVAKTFL